MIHWLAFWWPEAVKFLFEHWAWMNIWILNEVNCKSVHKPVNWFCNGRYDKSTGLVLSTKYAPSIQLIRFLNRKSFLSFWLCIFYTSWAKKKLTWLCRCFVSTPPGDFRPPAVDFLLEFQTGFSLLLVHWVAVVLNASALTRCMCSHMESNQKYSAIKRKETHAKIVVAWSVTCLFASVLSRASPD